MQKHLTLILRPCLSIIWNFYLIKIPSFEFNPGRWNSNAPQNQYVISKILIHRNISSISSYLPMRSTPTLRFCVIILYHSQYTPYSGSVILPLLYRFSTKQYLKWNNRVTLKCYKIIQTWNQYEVILQYASWQYIKSRLSIQKSI